MSLKAIASIFNFNSSKYASVSTRSLESNEDSFSPMEPSNCDSFLISEFPKTTPIEAASNPTSGRKKLRLEDVMNGGLSLQKKQAHDYDQYFELASLQMFY